jgi:hypothetical protein
MVMPAGNSFLLAIIFFVIGALLGALLTSLLSASRRDDEHESSPVSSSTGAQARRPAGLSGGSFQEIACLWRKDEQGKLITEIKGSAYPSVEQMSPTARQQSRDLAREWLTWLGEDLPQSTAPGQAPVAAARAPSLEDLKITLPSPAPKKKLPDILNDQEQEKKPEIIEDSIVVQIDNILQEMLTGSTLESRGIRLTEGANMSVIVWVGNEFFQGIDHVPDPVIAQVIRTAVAEWEKRSVPNR